MNEFTEPLAGDVRDSWLHRDHYLFAMYMDALNSVLRKPEIRQAFDEFELSAGDLRMRMWRRAARVFATAPEEFGEYQEAAASADAAAGTGPSQITHGSPWEPRNLLRNIVKGGATGGAVMIVTGAVSSLFWAPMAALAEAGATLLVVAAVVWVSPRLLFPGIELQSLGTMLGGGTGLEAARYRLMTAISETELLAQVRTFINGARQDRFGLDYSVSGTPGLSEVYDSTNRIPTGVAGELEKMLRRFDGASIGIAGPRGSGKSTLVRQYCDEQPGAQNTRVRSGFDWRWLQGYYLPRLIGKDLKCFVAAPVDYVARDFVLYMFAAFCRTVIGSYGGIADGLSRAVVTAFWLRRTMWLAKSLAWRVLFFGASALALWYWSYAVARALTMPRTWVDYAVIALACAGILNSAWSSAGKLRRWRRQASQGNTRALVSAARRHLSSVRYLQTYTSGWSGTLNLPGGAADGQYSRSVSRAEQPRSYPEIVDEFRSFARDVAAAADEHRSRVFIGIDELDKIGTAEQAEQFLNEIKGIFGIPHLYFMVAVSDDALTAFERRGLPLRTAFDSSFDEILHVGPLSYIESRRLLYRRVIGLSEPYVAFCHCLAGGLAREVIRAARQVVRAAASLNASGPGDIGDDADEDDLAEPSGYLLLRGEPHQNPPTLAAISAEAIYDELSRKLRASRHVLSNMAPTGATGLQDTFYQISHALNQRQLILDIVDLIAEPSPGESSEMESLRLDVAGYSYYCATLQEVFTDQLDSSHMIAATDGSLSSGSFDTLAGARAAFALDTLLAWRLVSQFRKAWSLETREPATRLPQPDSSG